MKKIKAIIFIYLLFNMPMSLWTQSQIDYSGAWASNVSERNSIDNATFLYIYQFNNENRYLVLSVGDGPDIFTFVGGGYVREDGFLQVTTDSGRVWLYTPAVVADSSKAISMSNRQNIETFETFISIEEKFDTWPFPLKTEK